jgi:methionyl-tRNA formyltransferase
MVAALRAVFFGTPQFAVPSLEALLDSHHMSVAWSHSPTDRAVAATR